MQALLIWLELTPLSLWVRGETGATMAFPIIICFHALGMGFLVGIATIINLRIMGMFPRLALTRLQSFLPFAWLGLVINAVSGLLLLVGYPTKALTNPVFYIKLFCIAVALWSLVRVRNQVLPYDVYDRERIPVSQRRVAMIACGLWAAAIIAGRLLAYTHTQLLSI